MQRESEVPARWLDPKIKKAFAHLGTVFDPSVNKEEEKEESPYYTAGYHYCHLYAVERVGSLARRHLIGGRDWYRLGANFLLAKQSFEGSWSDSTCMRPRSTLGTCFALLFLKRATLPVVTGAAQPK